MGCKTRFRFLILTYRLKRDTNFFLLKLDRKFSEGDQFKWYVVEKWKNLKIVNENIQKYFKDVNYIVENFIKILSIERLKIKFFMYINLLKYIFKFSSKTRIENFVFFPPLFLDLRTEVEELLGALRVNL